MPGRRSGLPKIKAPFFQNKKALSTPVRRSGLSEMVLRLVWTRISDLDQPPLEGLRGLVQIRLSGSEIP